MATTEFDVLIDNLCEEAFPIIDDILFYHPYTDARDMINYLCEDMNISQFHASHVYGAYLVNNKHKELYDNQEIHSKKSTRLQGTN